MLVRAEADPHVNRRSISPVREREDSRSRRALEMQDRSYSDTRDNPRSRARADSSISVSPNPDEGRNRSPSAADREPEVRSRESRNERPIRDSGIVPLETPIADKGIRKETGPEVTSPSDGRRNPAARWRWT